MNRTPGEKKTRSLEKHGLSRKDDTLGVRLLLTLEQHGLNQAEFAAWMEMSPATVCRGGMAEGSRAGGSESGGRCVSTTYERRKAEGVCTWCGRRPAEDGRVMCRACRERLREYYRAKRKKLWERRKAEGVCPRCGGPRDTPGRIICRMCRAFSVKYRPKSANVRAFEKPD